MILAEALVGQMGVVAGPGHETADGDGQPGVLPRVRPADLQGADVPAKDSRWVSVEEASGYGVEKGLISSFPIRSKNGRWEIVQGVPLNEFSRSRVDASVKELMEEKVLVKELIP